MEKNREFPLLFLFRFVIMMENNEKSLCFLNILHKVRNVETRILLQESLPQPPVSQLVLLLSADFGSSVYLLFGAFRELCPPGTAGRLRKPGDGSLAVFPDL